MHKMYHESIRCKIKFFDDLDTLNFRDILDRNMKVFEL